MQDRRTSNSAAEAFCKVLDRGVAFGRLVALRLPEGSAPVEDSHLEDLHPEERAHALGLRGRRRIEWVGGRLALHLAASLQGVSLGPVLVGQRGEPRLPPGVSASISHKRGIAAALVGLDGEGTVGLDIEELAPPRMAIGRRVLVEEEQEAIERLPPEERWPSLLRRFATKEAIYKAIHPHVGRFVGFDEAVVQEMEGAGPKALLRLREGEGPFSLEVEHLEVEEHFWAMVRAVRKGSDRWRK